jgi:hypothetical protein
MHLIGSTILACLNLAGWLAVAVLLFARQEAVFPDLSGGAAVGLALALAFWLTVCVMAVAGYARRCARCLRCRRDPDYLAGLSLDLKCAHRETRHQAFQTLADYCSQPLGWEGFWPFGSWAASQVERMRHLLTARFTVEAEVKAEAAERAARVEESAANDLGPRSVAEATEWLADVIKDSLLDWTPTDEDENGPAAEPLPPLEPYRFVEALRGPAEAALTSLAEAINEAPNALSIRAVPDPCIEVLGDFLDEALKVGLKLRVDAALAGLPALQGPHLPRRWKKYRAAAPPSAGPTRDWVKKFRRMKADEHNAPGT